MPSQKTLDDVERIAAALGGVQSGSGYKCFCPVHDDDNRSLQVSAGDKDIPVFHCFAGCSYDAITDALESKSLLPSRTIIERKPEPKKMTTATVKAPAKLRAVSRVSDENIERVYPYQDQKGRIVAQKVRYVGKDFRIRYADGENWVWKNPTTDPVPLMHLPAVLAGVKAGHKIVLCEGEKDVETVNSLNLEGYVATTNIEGAATWKKHHNDALTGAQEVIILEDNDPAGQARVRKVAGALEGRVRKISVVRFDDMDEKADVTDFYEAHGRDATIELLSTAPSIQETQGWLRPAGKRRADYSDYIDFIRSLPAIKKIVRDKLLDEPMVLTPEGEWKHALNMLDYCKGHALAHRTFFSANGFKEALHRCWHDDLKPEMRVDFPAWDGVDRIKQISEVLEFHDFDSAVWYELIKEWGATMWRRLDDCSIQPTMPVLQGPQGCGKDALIDALTGGLGDYCKELNITSFGLDEAKKQLHTALCFTIPEYDKTGKQDIASLKHILNAPYTSVRLSYDPRDEKRHVRCSFIASCNKERVLVDETGNRRFWIFRCKFLGFELSSYSGSPLQGTGKVLKDYPGLFCRPNYKEERLQIQAQFRQLAQERYQSKTLEKAEAVRVVMEATPEGLDDLIIDSWNSAGEAYSWANPTTLRDSQGNQVYTQHELDTVIENVTKKWGVSRKYLLALLKGRGGYYRKADGRYYRPVVRG